MALPNKEWQCSLCTFVNKSKYSQCSMCNNPKHDKNNQKTQQQNDTDKNYEQPTGALAIKNGDKDNEEQSFELFSTRKPKDFSAGLSSGLKNVGKGIGAGLATAIAAPIAGAREGGLAGFGKGVGIGLIGAVVLPVGGVATGLYQIGRGVMNTPEAIKKSKENQEWDHKKRQWYTYNLQKEAEIILKMSEEDFLKTQHENANKNDEQKSEKQTVKVKDPAFYNLLNVDTNASPSEIKRAYYKKARLLHPDKHPDEHEKYQPLFQELSAAYQILSDPKLRERYDCGGPDGMGDIPVMDSSAFFQIMFGSEKFDYYVGELQLTQMLNSGMNAMDKAENNDDQSDAVFESLFANDAALKFRQTKREVQCAVNLVTTLQTYIENSEEFKKKLEKEAAELAGNAIGATLLKVIGYVYMEQSEKMLGFKHSVGAGLGFTDMKRRGHEMANKYRMVKSAYNTYKTAKKYDESMEKKGQGNDDEEKKDIDETKPMMGMIETLWNYTVIDVEGTLRSACHKLDKDSSVSAKVRGERARGLYEMGKIFEAKGVSAAEGLRVFEEQMKEGIEMRKNIEQHKKEQEEQQIK